MTEKPQKIPLDPKVMYAAFHRVYGTPVMIDEYEGKAQRGIPLVRFLQKRVRQAAAFLPESMTVRKVRLHWSMEIVK